MKRIVLGLLAALMLWNFGIAPSYSQSTSDRIAIEPLNSVQPEGNSGTTPFTFTVTRSGDTSGFLSTDYQVTGTGANPADVDDFNNTLTNNETTTADTVIPSTSQEFEVSLSLPDSSTDASVLARGFVNSGDVARPPINIAYVVDVSGSMGDPFAGSISVGDLNSNGTADERLDATIAGFESLNQSIVDIGFANTRVNIGIVSFASQAKVSAIANPADSTISTTLRGFKDGGGTNFEAALHESIGFLNTAPKGDNFVFFLSDGMSNRGGDFNVPAATLRDPNGLNANIRAIGIGSGASLDQLDQLDDGSANDSAERVLNPESLIAQLSKAPIQPATVDRVELYLDGNLAETIPGSSLQTTPLGLKYEVTLSGLDPSAANTVEVRAIASDPAATSVATQQVIEATPIEQFLPSGTISFTPNEASKTLTFEVVGDLDVESDEGFQVHILNPFGGLPLLLSADGTIVNDDDVIPTPIEQAGNTDLLVGKTYQVQPDGGNAIDISFFIGTPITPENVALSGFEPLGAEQLADGSFQLVLENVNDGRLILWNLDSNGIRTGSESLTPDEVIALEASFEQDLNGDGAIGLGSTPVEQAGNTDLLLGDVYQVRPDGGSAIDIIYQGSSLEPAALAPFELIGAEQLPDGSFQVAIGDFNGGIFFLLRLDSTGVDMLPLTFLQSDALIELEPSFEQDLNGDGIF